MIQDIPVFRDDPPGGKVFLVGGLNRLTAAYYGEGAATIPPTDELSRVDYCGNMVYDRGERRLLLENGYITFDITTNALSYHFYLGNNRVVMAGYLKRKKKSIFCDK